MKFKSHGHSSPDPKRSRVPSPVRSGSAARITFQLHAHTYTSSVKLHYNTTKTQTTTTIIFVSQYILQLLECSGGGGGSHKYQCLWSFTQKIMEYQWACCPLSSTHPLPHPPDSSSSMPAFSDREDVQNSEQEEPLPLLHHRNLLPLRLFHHWKTRVRHLLLH